MDALERLIALAEQGLDNDPVDKEVDPLATLSLKEIRERFDKNGEPREGFDIDGNFISTPDEDDWE